MSCFPEKYLHGMIVITCAMWGILKQVLLERHVRLLVKKRPDNLRAG
jgi:hypothetical protein